MAPTIEGGGLGAPAPAVNRSSKERTDDGDGDDDDDYMKMTFDAPTATPTQPESSLQRAQRLKRESRARGIIKSKAEREAEATAARERALATSLLDDPRSKQSKGLAMMAKMGFTGGGLGKTAETGTPVGRTEPIKVSIKGDRGGIGLESEKKRPRLDEEAANPAVNKSPKLDPDQYRERVRREREEARLERQIQAAQRLAERLDEETSESTTKPSALSSLPVIYRGLVGRRLEEEEHLRRRREFESSLGRLPTYRDDDEDGDADYAVAMGEDVAAMGPTSEGNIDEGEGEGDGELDAFNALPPSERLRSVLEYLRQHHHYCFWCKMAYPDEAMDGCPGLTEDDHD